MTLSAQYALAAVTLGAASLAANADPVPLTGPDWDLGGSIVAYDLDGFADNGPEAFLSIAQNKMFSFVPEGYKTYDEANAIHNLYGVDGFGLVSGSDMQTFIAAFMAAAAPNPITDYALIDGNYHWTKEGGVFGVFSGDFANAVEPKYYSLLAYDVAPQNNAPEPGSLALLGAAGVAAALGRRRAKGLEVAM